MRCIYCGSEMGKDYEDVDNHVADCPVMLNIIQSLEQYREVTHKVTMLN